MIYKGYAIRPIPVKLQNDEGWRVCVSIDRYDGEDFGTCKFDASDTFDSEDEAKQHSIFFGQEIIEGQHAGLSVKDL